MHGNHPSVQDMFNRAYPACDERSTRCSLEMPRATVHTLRFPESFSRTSPLHDADPLSDVSLDTTPPNETESYMFPMLDTMGITDDRSPSPPHHSSKNSAMKLENILNDVPIGWDPYPRSRSLVESPSQSDVSFEAFVFPTVKIPRSVSPVDRVVKKKKVKMHKCPECQKEFPRPSGLKTHMNMHTKEKPFACTYPGCNRSFSVVSNAKRHMRTHGVGVRIEDHSSESSSPVPYVVGFETPVIVAPAEADVKEPLKLRWVPPSSCTTGSCSGTPSIGSSRARSLSGARDADLVNGVNHRRVIDDVWKTESIYDFRSTSSELDSHSDVESPLSGSREFSTGSSSSSPRSYGEDNNLFFGHRRVESERSPRTTSGLRYLEARAVNRYRPELTN